MLDPEHRRNRILEVLRQEQEISVSELSSKFEVTSLASLRRDLRALETKGLVNRAYGRVSLTPASQHLSSLEKRLNTNREAKKKIAKRVSDLVGDGEVIFFDTGSTALYVARELRFHKELTIVTNSLPVARELGGYPYIRVVLTGGIYHSEEQCLVGSIAEQFLRNYRSSKSIIGADGVTGAEGVTSHDPEIAPVTRTMIECSNEVIVVTDYTKIGTRGVVGIAPPSSIDILVTNRQANPEVIKVLETAGVKVLLA